MNTRSYSVDLPYTRQELLTLFAFAHSEYVDDGGCYDARSAAINVWTHHWANPGSRYDSDLIGTLYFAWGDENRLWKVEAERGFDLDDLLKELGDLEKKSLGKVRYGKLP